MNQYEIAILFDPGLEVDMDKATSKVEKIFTDNGGTITNTDNWGKKKLAYSINKHDSAIYVFYAVEVPGVNVRKIESILNITDEVIRFLIVRPDLKKIARAEAAKAVKAEQAAKRSERDDKEEEE
ncbi:MAG: small subunit ribosomal protein [Patescibacteria group bacterium]|nr:30S ribosomal protein S6 [Candidatus Saccharibacteria bacterium]MDQ5963788.1 small subunit ribosomal protein [Patescibacteria group bacterium]